MKINKLSFADRAIVYIKDKSTGEYIEAKPVVDHEMYLVTKDGRVFSTYTGEFLISYPTSKEHPYQVVGFKTRGKRYQLLISRLVARAWVPNPNKKGRLEVNHKDLNKLNNHADNLEWVTRKQNMKHSTTSYFERGDGSRKGWKRINNGVEMRNLYLGQEIPEGWNWGGLPRKNHLNTMIT